MTKLTEAERNFLKSERKRREKEEREEQKKINRLKKKIRKKIKGELKVELIKPLSDPISFIDEEVVTVIEKKETSNPDIYAKQWWLVLDEQGRRRRKEITYKIGKWRTVYKRSEASSKTFEDEDTIKDLEKLPQDVFLKVGGKEIY